MHDGEQKRKKMRNIIGVRTLAKTERQSVLLSHKYLFCITIQFKGWR